MKVANGNVSYFGSIVDYNYILNMIQEKDTGDIFMTFYHGVGLLGYQTRAFSVIAGSATGGFKDGSFNRMRFSYSHSIKFLNSHALQFSSVLFHILYHKSDNNECLQVD